MNATTLLVYELKAAVLLAVFYMGYRLLLNKETFHKVNRIVLLSTAALSFLLPFCVITVEKTVPLPATPLLDSQAASAILEQTASPMIPNVLLGILVAGILAVGFKTLRSLAKVMRLIRKGRKEFLEDGTQVIVCDKDICPFSWMSYIVVSETDWQALPEEIIRHEKAHRALGHSYDILFTDLITAFQWFNPAVWMLRQDLRALHEYQADDCVLKSGINASQYQLLLIKKAVGQSGYSIANSFNNSTLKNRITMMNPKKSNSVALLKVLMLLPVIGISLAVNAKTQTVYAPAEPSTAAVSVDKGNVSLPDTVTYYINNEKVSKTIVDALDPNTIENIAVNKSNRRNQVRITLKSADAKQAAKADDIIIVGYKAEVSPMEKEVNDTTAVKITLRKKGDGTSANGTLDPIIFVDGKKITPEEMNAITADRIESISVEKDTDIPIIRIILKK